jgi:DNA-binding PadR family transcriptional regulator
MTTLSEDDLGRFAEPSLLILTSLAEGPRHGYALIRDVEEFAGVTLGPGTLYGALARLEKRGLIRGLETDDRRRPYELTLAGATALGRQLANMRAVADVGLRRLEPTGPATRATPATA